MGTGGGVLATKNIFFISAPAAPSCWVPGRCQGVLIDFGTAPNPDECLADCKVSTRWMDGRRHH